MTAPVSRSGEDWRLTRARRPHQEGFVDRDGVRIHYEVFGKGTPSILILPTWSVLHSAHGRFQIADLARDHQVITFDGRGNGRSDRPAGRDSYGVKTFADDAIGVLDATGTDRAVVVACSRATYWMVDLAARYPDRIVAGVSSGTSITLDAEEPEDPDAVAFDEPYRSTEGWAMWNAAYWRDHYESFLRFFFSQVWTEPHSQSVIDDSVAWGLETAPHTLIDTVGAPTYTEEEMVDLVGRVHCPMLVIHGGSDSVSPVERSVRLAREVDGRLVILDGAGHCSGNREPARFDIAVREFLRSLGPADAEAARPVRRPSHRPRVLIVPDGADPTAVERDRSIVAALRRLRPKVDVEWLAPPASRQWLEDHDEVVHPASDKLLCKVTVNAARPGGPKATDYDAWRRSDEARFADFMLFDDLVTAEPFDLVVADGAWQIDHYLHEAPSRKRFAFAWLTDQMGWPAGPDADAASVLRVADANAAMIDLAERGPDVRDLAVFLGAPADIPDELPGVDDRSLRTWAQSHFTFADPTAGGIDDTIATRIASLLDGLPSAR